MDVSRNKSFPDVVKKAVADCLGPRLRSGQSIGVAYSGGLDSTVLLRATASLAYEWSFPLIAIHVHHGLSQNADQWALHCQQICTELGVRAQISRVDVSRMGSGIEDAARRARYQVLSESAADWMLLAHHGNDQAETVLHNLLRGTGVRGAAAMPAERGKFLRPLLELSREALHDYACHFDLGWVEDESNQDSDYTRNYLRHQVMPVIQSRFPQAVMQLVGAARRFREAQCLLDELALVDIEGHVPAFPLPISLFVRLSTPRAKNLLRALLTWQDLQAPDERRLNEFVRQLKTAGADRHPRADFQSFCLFCGKGRIYLEPRGLQK